MSFWRTFGFHTISPVETVLDRENFTLEELLDEEELLQECKSHNKKLVDYLVKPDTLKQIFNYLTVAPEENAEPKRKTKYPFVCGEIICSEVWAVYEAIFENEQLLDSLYTCLEKPPPLTTPHVSKVAGCLLVKKSHESMAYLKKRGPSVVTGLLQHIDNASVMDLVIKIISCETADTPEILQWFVDANLIAKLITKLNPSAESDVHDNSAQTLVDIIVVSGNNPSSPLMQQLESPENISALFDCVLNSGNNTSLLTSGLTVLMELFKRYSQTSINTELKLENLPPLYTLLAQYLPKLKDLLGNPGSKILVLSYSSFPPLGVNRLKLVEFVLCLIRGNYGAIHEELVTSGILSKCLDLFFEYHWNNFLHATIDAILHYIYEGQNQDLKVAVLKECKLHERICTASKENDDCVGQPKGVRRGNMAFITRISTLLCQEYTRNEAVARILDEFEPWKVYVNTALARIQELEAHPSNQKPLSLEPTSSEEEEADDFDKNNTASLVFTQYLAQQGFSSLYPEGFNDEDDSFDEEAGESFFDAESQFNTPGLFSTDEKKLELDVDANANKDFVAVTNHVEPLES